VHDDFSPVEIGSFRNVDAADPNALIAYLDAVSQLGAEEKRKSYEALRLTTGMSVLELGCGTGDDARAIAELVGASGKVCGIDSSSAMVDAARARGVPANVTFLEGRAESLPFEDASFDAARAERVFQHLDDPQSAARELRRVMRDGGMAFVLDPDWETVLMSGADRALTRRIVRAMMERIANPSAGSSTPAMLRTAGFRVVTATPVLSTPSLARAYDLFLGAAIDYAISAGAVDPADAAAWLRALLEAEQRGEFLCAVTAVATLATA
jgi:ubiquinone/menaquinone biosynthesis C-methylase UbiE